MNTNNEESWETQEVINWLINDEFSYEALCNRSARYIEQWVKEENGHHPKNCVQITSKQTGVDAKALRLWPEVDRPGKDSAGPSNRSSTGTGPLQ